MLLSLRKGFSHLPSLVSFMEGQKKRFLPPSDSWKVSVPSEPRAKLGAPAHSGGSAASHTLISGNRAHPASARMEQGWGRQAKGSSRSQGNGSKLLRLSDQAFRR